jgi:hypothetical protein
MCRMATGLLLRLGARGLAAGVEAEEEAHTAVEEAGSAGQVDS